jgi:hypothetical protein
MIRVRRMNPQPYRGPATPWYWCRPRCPDDHDWCVAWRGDSAILVVDYAPHALGPCVAVKRKRGVWWWVYNVASGVARIHPDRTPRCHDGR